MVVIDMSDSTPALHYNSLPRIVEQLISYFYFILYTHCRAKLIFHFILYTLLNIIVPYCALLHFNIFVL